MRRDGGKTTDGPTRKAKKRFVFFFFAEKRQARSISPAIMREKRRGLKKDKGRKANIICDIAVFGRGEGESVFLTTTAPKAH